MDSEARIVCSEQSMRWINMHNTSFVVFCRKMQRTVHEKAPSGVPKEAFFLPKKNPLSHKHHFPNRIEWNYCSG